MKNWFLRIGITKGVLALVTAATLISLGIAAGVVVLTGGNLSRTFLLAATVTPAITAGFFSILILRLSFELEEAERLNKELASTDELTGLRNRRSFMEMADCELGLAKRYGAEFTLLLIDVDELKTINDRYGHLVGDDVLQLLAEACSQVIRQTNVVARLGGDEFVLLISNSAWLDLEAYCERIHQKTSELEFSQQPGLDISISIGAARYTDSINTIDELMAMADRKMYAAKGRPISQEPSEKFAAVFDG